jgi:dTDP-4-amino-4,6-dideoxygalactose transaminase
MNIPLTRPSPPRLSTAGAELRAIEQRGIFSNFGPVNTEFEAAIVEQLFNGVGHCTTVCNATLGLILAIRQAIAHQQTGQKRYALMPSFTFAAAAQAALWNGLTPLFVDIDPITWAADPEEEARLLRQHGQDIAVILPYATFGYAIDLAHYEALSQKHGIPVVLDAAASLGTLTAAGTGFGTGSAIPIIFSIHATKAFATGEGGIVYSTDKSLIQSLKTMANFGFGRPRNATMLGLNAKMTEVGALTGLLRLKSFAKIADRRQTLMDLYRAALPELTFQPRAAFRQSHQFASALLPPGTDRATIQARLVAEGIGSGSYFSPHLAEQDFFAETCPPASLPVTHDIASRIISLPLHDKMKNTEILEVARALRACITDKGCLAEIRYAAE